jgi:hypothetical protein
MIDYKGDLLTKSPSGESREFIYGIEKDKKLEDLYKIRKLNEGDHNEGSTT